jgi:hypothetical protein
MIRQRYREEFEGAGIHHVRNMVEHGNYPEEEKRRHAQLWIDERARRGSGLSGRAAETAA